jgi:hypothetical protein
VLLKVDEKDTHESARFLAGCLAVVIKNFERSWKSMDRNANPPWAYRVFGGARRAGDRT